MFLLKLWRSAADIYKSFLEHMFLSASSHFGVEDKILTAGNISDCLTTSGISQPTEKFLKTWEVIVEWL